MARSQSSTALQFAKWSGAAAAAIVGGVAIGYLYGNARDLHPPVQPAVTPVATPLTPAPSLNPSSVHPRKTNGNYTAPGAPHIVIEEESQPILHRSTPSPAPPPDPEATQEAPPAPTPTPDQPKPAVTTTTPPGSTGDTTLPVGTPGTNSSPPAPAANPPAGSAPADPDFEHINNAPSGSSDPESGQQGGQSQPGTQTAPSGGLGDSGKAQFRVQTGAYTDESDARSVADTLRSQGYSTSTRSERDGDYLVYKVQVGAYRSKNGASKAADDLQKEGFPAYVSPISP